MFDMHPFDELKAYVSFTEEDSRSLAQIKALILPHLDFIVTHFYDRVLLFPKAKSVLADDKQVLRLQNTLKIWAEEMLSGPHDYAYYEKRLRIGKKHTQIHLPPQYMFTAMHVLKQDILDILAAHHQEEHTYRAIHKITDIELAIMVGTYMENHERKELEEFRDIVVSHLPLTTFIIDDKGHIVSLSREDPEIFSTSTPIGVSYQEAIHQSFAEHFDLPNWIERALQAGRDVVLPRVDLPANSNGIPRSYRISILPLQRNIARVLVHVEDLTDAISAEARIRHAEHLAKLGTMAAVVAHEVRNPLAGISATIQVFATTLPEQDNRRNILSKVRDQISRLDNLVSDLLSFAKPINVQQRVVDLAHLVQSILAAADTEHVAIEQIGNGSAFCDGTLVQQILLNLVHNAKQAGAKRLQIAISAGEILVADDGPGIPAAMREQIFEPFFTTKTRGTGLGLPVARKMAESMGGSLYLANSTLGGAGFALCLPKLPED